MLSSIFKTAVSLVTSNDNLIDSIEGLECITLEGIYHNNVGNLRRSWLVMRKGMMVAQMMGLHCKSHLQALKFLERETSAYFDSGYMWFRLVQFDRFLSLLLGLPQGSSEDSFATAEALSKCTPLDRLQRIDCVAAGRILQRNLADIEDRVVTQEIDQLLQDAAGSMPSKWWLTMNLPLIPEVDSETPQEITRVLDQFTHFNMLLHLHLPFLLRCATDRRYDYSILTVINASREVLALFLRFRSFSASSPHCRCGDFFAFRASTALCLAHMEGHRYRAMQRDGSGDFGSYGTIFESVAHQRLSDRAMLERVHESMDWRAGVTNDILASKIASIIQPLLAIEADAAKGHGYSTQSSPVSGADCPEIGGEVCDGGNVLRIHIPYFGTINIERRGVTKSTSHMHVPEEHGAFPIATYIGTDPSRTPVSGSSTSASLLHTQDGQNCEHQQVATIISQTSDTLDTQTNWTDAFGFNDDCDLDSRHLLPDFAASVEDWALQGVDMAFFDSLIHSTIIPNTEEN
jgi:hypothetical protein